MKKIFLLVLTITVVSIMTITGAATASAKGHNQQPIDLSATIFVTAIDGLETNLHSGWSTIEAESLEGGLITVTEGPAVLQTTYITAEQSSREQFTSFNLYEANVIKGRSDGQFKLISGFTNEVLVLGDYDLKVSSIPGCQIYGEGNWISKAKSSIIAGHGDITVCTNWIWFTPDPQYGGTFMTNVSVTGSASLVD